MPFISPLFAADFGFVIQILVVLAFLFGGWLIRQLGQMGQKQMETQRRQQQQRRRQEQQQQGETGEDQMEGEINDFLRRAAGQRGETQPAKVEVVQPPPYEPMPSELHPVAEYVESEEVDVARESNQFSHETEAYRQQHIHDSFDDQLGVQSALDVHAAHDAKTTAEEGATQAHSVETGFSTADIVAAFRDPTDVRKAIVMSEILTPRGDRLP